MHPIERLRAVARASGAPPTVLAREAAATLAAFGHDPALLLVSSRRLLEHHPSAAPLWWMVSTVLTAPDPSAAAWDAVEALDDDPTADQAADLLPDVSTLVLAGPVDVLLDAVAERDEQPVFVVDLGDPARRRRRRGGTEIVFPDELPALIGPGDVVLTELVALGPTGWLPGPGVLEVVELARALGAEVWGIAGVGRVLPAALLAVVARRTAEADAEAEARLLDDATSPADDPPPSLLQPLALLDVVIGPGGLHDPLEAAYGPTCAVAPELLRF